MHVKQTSYASLEGTDLPYRYRTKDDEFIGIFVARGSIRLSTASGRKAEGSKASYFLVSRRTEFEITKTGGADCVIGWISFEIDGLQARMLLKTLPDVLFLANLGKEEYEWQVALETLISSVPTSLTAAAAAINRRLIEVNLISIIQSAMHRDGSIGPRSFEILGPELAPVLREMHAHPDRSWTTATLADRAGMSRSLFCKIFADAVGTTPIRYLRNLRLELAVNLLRETLLPLSVIAHRVGYQSDQAFLRAFQSGYKMTPGRFRAIGATPAAFDGGKT